MNWHEAVAHAQQTDRLRQLMSDAYLTDNLVDNCERFRASTEFRETIKNIRAFSKIKTGTLLDIGAGNGISAIAFALEGYSVTALEPDASPLVGTEAIRFLQNHYKIKDLEILQSTTESAQLKEATFDVVYARQCLHHANDLKLFVANAYRFLKPGGVFMSTRDHVIWDQEDKKLFLQQHPLHSFYGGENAFTEKEYETAFLSAGFTLRKRFKHFDSVINFAPTAASEINDLPLPLRQRLGAWIGPLASVRLIRICVKKLFEFLRGPVYDERHIPGRLRSYILLKPKS